MAKILSIEDDQDTQRLIGAALFKEGYEMHYAWNGQEGYEKLLSLNPDLLLLDLMLPVMNGIELMKKIHENKALRDLPVIIVTTYGDEANMLKYSVEALGAAYYLRKPVDLKELVSCVKRVLARYPRAPAAQAAEAAKELRKGHIRADPRFLTVWIHDRLVATLSRKEFSVLELLMAAPGSVAKDELLRGLGYDKRQTDALKQVLHRLRKALGPTEERRVRATPEGYELIG